jgi:LuxR family maltose regulon positive regulatory protein
MLDDTHLLQDARVLAALRWLIDYAPPHFHIALTSRHPLPEPVSLSLSRLEARGMAARFDLRDLRFTPEESTNFLRDQLGAVEPQDASRIHELTDGWPAGLQLFAVDLRAKQGGAYIPVHVRDAETFASFEREILVRLAPPDLQLLTCLSACDRFCGALGATLLGTPDDGPEIGRRLGGLALDGLFLVRIGDAAGDHTWYRLHPLLREVLEARGASLPPVERRSVHASAWQWFAANGLVEEAVGHAVRAGEPDVAADMVEHSAIDHLKRGELNRLAGLLRRLPSETIASRFRLELTMAYLHMYAGEADALEASLHRLQVWSDTPDKTSAHRRYALAVLRGGLALVRDDTDAVAALLPELHRLPPGSDDFTLTARANILSWMHIYRGEYGEAREVIEDGAPCDGAPRGILLGRCMGGMTHAAEGDVMVAERIFRDVLAASELHGRTYAGVAHGIRVARRGTVRTERRNPRRECWWHASTYWNASRSRYRTARAADAILRRMACRPPHRGNGLSRSARALCATASNRPPAGVGAMAARPATSKPGTRIAPPQCCKRWRHWQTDTGAQRAAPHGKCASARIWRPRRCTCITMISTARSQG